MHYVTIVIYSLSIKKETKNKIKEKEKSNQKIDKNENKILGFKHTIKHHCIKPQ